MQKLRIRTARREEMVDITTRVSQALVETSLSNGICVLYCPHTTAAVTINEGADPAVASDIIDGLARLVPRDGSFTHQEGNSDAHIKASLIGPSATIIVQEGRPMLGTWQRIFFCEFDGPRDRELFLQFAGEETEGR